eukprot:TRINITY_DN6355_c0_g1_i1.p1 TRINITY_DN6355_c0_g1~~TRINITY_DN6355_c0_g1_i1.p1  ORF type:complete len:513 (+),score=120.60 TRINITY_DN6355_c0_g1_i1:50-1540(+)
MPATQPDHPVSLGSAEQSERHREAGNAALKADNPKAAEMHYGMALSTAASVEQYGLGHLNRAVARLRMSNYEGARNDSERASALMPENPKAWFRLGEARRHLQDYHKAMQAYETAESFAPGDKLIQKALDTCVTKLEAQQTNDIKSEIRNSILSKLEDDAPEQQQQQQQQPDSKQTDGSPEVIYITPGMQVSTSYLPGGVMKRKKKKKPVKKKSHETDYARFEKLEKDLSDDEKETEKSTRMLLEATPNEVQDKAKIVFRHFDEDNDGYWDYNEASKATKTLENRNLTVEDYLARCEEYQTDKSTGWPSHSVQCMYAMNPDTRKGLEAHHAHVSDIIHRKKGAVIHKYEVGDLVEGKLEAGSPWQPGQIHSLSDTEQDAYNVVWSTGSGTTGVPASCLRPREVGYTGPTGLRGEGKKMSSGIHVDPATGLPCDPSGSSAPSFAAVGSKLLDAVPEKSGLPEEPVRRLLATTSILGMEDPTTGLPSKRKLKNVLGQR